MFNFSVLISLLIAILSFYLPTFINLKKEIDDLFNTQKTPAENYIKIRNRKKKIRTLNLITLTIVLIVFICYFSSNILNLLNMINLNYYIITLSDIGNFFLKLVPFRKGFFSNSYFMFSYITELILSLVLGFFSFLFLLQIKHEPNTCSKILIIFVLEFILLWVNKFISSFFVYCIIHYFYILSLILNLLIYLFPIILQIIYIRNKIDEAYFGHLDEQKNNE